MKRYWLLLWFIPVLMVAPTIGAKPAQQFDDPIEQGRYLVQVAGCIGCHTPYADPAVLQIDESQLFAGGNPFPLGPAGIVYASNLTPDETSGLGAWTDEEIRAAIQLGIKRDGSQLHPIMPFLTYNKMADADVAAIIAYLRTVPSINNLVPTREATIPPVPPLQLQTIAAPTSSDVTARGNYLVTAVMACNDCHTPLNAETGQPIMEQYLAGGQPYEGPWGVVYGANITPHEATGLGGWSDEEIGRAIREGIRIDGRRLIVMPWREYKVLTNEDLTAVIHFLRNNVQPVENKVPAVALAEGLLELLPVAEESNGVPALLIIGAAVGLVVLAVLLAIRLRRN